MALKHKLRQLIEIGKYIRQHPLSGRYYFRGWLKFIKWQLSQLYPHEVKMKFVDGTYYLAKKGWSGITGNIYTGLHDFEEMGFLLHFLREDDLFIDVGANMGSYSILAAGVVKSYVLAFEPSKETFERLKMNILINRLNDKVSLYNIGLGGTHKCIEFSKTLDAVNHVVEEGNYYNTAFEMVQLEALDTILLKHVAKPVMIKIDVEGFEWEVLVGMTNLLEDTTLKVIIIELNGSGMRYGYEDKRIHEKLLKAGF